MWTSKLTKNIEQPSDIVAEDNLPKPVTHVYQSGRLQSNIDIGSIPNVMCFYATDTTVFMGVVTEETNDSFLVGAGASLRMDKDRNITAEEITSQPLLRFFKSAIKYMVLPTDMSLYHYFAFLQNFGYNRLPEYFTDERKKYIADFRINSIYNKPKELDLTPVETSPEPPGDSPHSFTPHTQSESIH